MLDFLEDLANPFDWTDAEICAAFDENPSLTVAELSSMTGRSRQELRAMLMQNVIDTKIVPAAAAARRV